MSWFIIGMIVLNGLIGYGLGATAERARIKSEFKRLVALHKED